MKYLFSLFFFCLSISILHSQNRNTGLSFNDVAYSAIPVTAPLARGDFDNLPSSMNLQVYAPTPGNQGQTGTCVAWSSAYHARVIAESIRLNRTNLSEINANVYAPSFVYNQIRKEPGCEKGTFIHEALELLSAKGVPKYKDLPFDCEKVINNNDLESAATHKIEGYKILFNINDNNKILPVKKSLAEKKPVLIGMMCADSFFDAKGVWQPTAAEYEKSFSGHAMVTIGYDDAQYGGAFLIMNSWGTEWGNQGFMWIRYNDFAHFVKYAFEMIEKQPEEKLSNGGILIKKSDGNTMNVEKISDAFYRTTTSYSSGTAFRLYISNQQPAYIYAIGSDLSKIAYQVFPHQEDISPYLGYQQSNVPIPDETHYVRMDQKKGKDYFCVLYSSTPLDIKSIMQNLEKSEGASFMERLKKTLGNKLILQGLDYKDNQAAFKGGFSGEGIVTLVVEIDHI
jgi:hypothetical protein